MTALLATINTFLVHVKVDYVNNWQNKMASENHYVLWDLIHEHDLPISINDILISPFREDFIFTKLRLCEVSR